MPRSAVLTDEQREQNLTINKRRYKDKIKEALARKDLALRRAHRAVILDTDQGGHGEVL